MQERCWIGDVTSGGVRYKNGEISSPITCVESPIDEFPVGEARFGIAGEEEWDYDADIQEGGGKVAISPDVDQDATLITASDVDG